MNEAKLQKLLSSARGQPAPAPEPDFEQRVLRAIRSDQRLGAMSVLDQLAALFPRLVWASLVVICLCVLTDVGLSSFGGHDLASGVAELADLWLFPSRGF